MGQPHPSPPERARGVRGGLDVVRALLVTRLPAFPRVGATARRVYVATEREQSLSLTLGSLPIRMWVLPRDSEGPVSGPMLVAEMG